VHANQVKQWKDQLLEGAAVVFGTEAGSEPPAPAVDIMTLHAKIGELTLVNDFLESTLGIGSRHSIRFGSLRLAC
jgi:transposase